MTGFDPLKGPEALQIHNICSAVPLYFCKVLLVLFTFIFIFILSHQKQFRQNIFGSWEKMWV